MLQSLFSLYDDENWDRIMIKVGLPKCWLFKWMVVDVRVVVAERPRSIRLGLDTLPGRDELVVNIVRPIARIRADGGSSLRLSRLQSSLSLKVHLAAWKTEVMNVISRSKQLRMYDKQWIVQSYRVRCLTSCLTSNLKWGSHDQNVSQMRKSARRKYLAARNQSTFGRLYPLNYSIIALGITVLFSHV